MSRKSFKLGNSVIGKIKTNRNKRGIIRTINTGPNRKCVEVQWSDGSREIVTTRAINVLNGGLSPDQSEQSNSSDSSSDDINGMERYFSGDSDSASDDTNSVSDYILF